MVTVPADLRVLLLEDDPLVRRLWERMAARLVRAAVVTVATEAEAREALEEDRFHLVLCDFHLGAGKTSRRLIEDLSRGGQPPVAVLTSDPVGAMQSLAVRVRVFSKFDGLPHILGELGLGLCP